MPDYPSNISRAQFALIQPDLENFRKHTRPRRYDLYERIQCHPLLAYYRVSMA